MPWPFSGLDRVPLDHRLVDLDAQPRSFRHRRVTVYHLNRIAHQLLTQRRVFDAELQQRRVGDLRQKVQRRRDVDVGRKRVVDDRPAAVIRRVGDLLRLGETADARRVDLDHVDEPAVHQVHV